MLRKKLNPGSNERLSFLRNVQMGSEGHPASCPMVTGGSFPEDEVADLVPRSKVAL
jgi:hypothetical protein